MNKNSKSSLSGSDQSCLTALECNFELLDLLTGGVQNIYDDFNLVPDKNSNDLLENIDRRREIFTGTVIKINK